MGAAITMHILEKMRLIFKGIRLFLFCRYGKVAYDAKALNQHQQKSWERFQQSTLTHSGYFRPYYRQPLSQWPIMNKEVMMNHFNEMNTVGIDKDKAFEIAIRSEKERDFSSDLNGVTIGLSSGTSGNRGMFIASKEDRLSWMVSILAKVLPPWWLRKQRIGLFLRANSTLYETINGMLYSFKFFDLIKPIKVLIKEVDEFNPSVLAAPPSVLVQLAKHKQQGLININPEKIISVAEVLEPLDEQLIRTSFSQIVHQIYQCTEGFLGVTCEEGTLHLNEENLIIEKEFLDQEKRKFVPIITDFTRQAQPIIRYRLNDILTLRKEPCPCGRQTTALEFIEGRCDDIFYFWHLNGKEQTMVFPDFIRRAIITSSPHISEYFVNQVSREQLNIAIRVSNLAELSEIQSGIKSSLTDLFDKLNISHPEISFVDKEHQPGVKKMKRIKRCFSVN